MGETLNEWVFDKNNKTVCLKINQNLVGSAIFRNMKINNIGILYVYLICVYHKF
jgi:hypothetical protein